MRLPSNFRSILLACSGALALAACTQGEDIASPGPTNPGTPPGGGGGGGGGGTTADTCPSGFTEAATPIDIFGSTTDQTVCDIAGTFFTNTTLPFKDDNGDGIGVAYRISGRIDIGVDVGFDGTDPNGDQAIFTIEPGVTLFGESGDDFIVVNRGSQLVADGEANAPIVFTSRADLEADPSVNRSDNIGEWGGLVMLGRAPINDCATGVLGTASCSNVIEGVTAPEASYGGGEPGDTSGTLRYVQVRFAGFPLSAGNELNGISFGGVGTGTTLEYIQVHNNSDDGVEFFGGTANIRYLVLTGNDDDSLDTDQGWDGRAQFVLVQQADGRGDNGFEMSSTGVGVTPATNPLIANFTILSTTRSSSPGRGIRLNTGHIGRFMNGVVTDTTEACLRWDQTDSDTGDDIRPGNANDTFEAGSDPQFNSVTFDCANGLERSDPDAPGAVASVGADANNNIGGSTISTLFQAGPAELPPTATPVAVEAVDPFFVEANYLGAFGPDESATDNWATGWTFNLFPEPECPNVEISGDIESTATSRTINGVNVCRITGVITDDVTLVRGNFYELDGRVDIGVDTGFDGAAADGDSVALTIESGVSIFGNSGADFLIVNRGSQIFSNGTRQNPVDMTSENDLLGTVAPNLRLDTIGEWGGLVILGRAPINDCATGSIGAGSCSNVIEGVTAPEASYGGNLATDNSGSLMYTRVKFAGFPLAAGNELNGISMGGVGSDTVVDFVQVHNNSDDGIEMFGGTANLRHIVLTGNDDDSLDTDQGWDGNAQFVIVKQRDGRGDNGFEMSSTGVGVTPATDPTIANFTIVSTTRTSSPGRGIRLNTGHIGTFLNGVITDTAQECLRWDETDSDTGDDIRPGNANDTFEAGSDPSFDNILFDCVGGLARNDAPGALASVAAGADNTTSTSVNLLNGFINDTAADGRPAFTDLPGNVDPFFVDTDYIGAVESSSDDWWAEWTCGLAADDC